MINSSFLFKQYRLRTLVIGLIVFAVLWWVTAYPRGAAMASIDVVFGHYEVQTYGLPGAYSREYSKLLNDRYGIRRNRVAGCCVWPGLVEYASGYNDVMHMYLNKKFGKDIFDECYDEARADSDRKYQAEYEARIEAERKLPPRRQSPAQAARGPMEAAVEFAAQEIVHAVSLTRTSDLLASQPAFCYESSGGTIQKSGYLSKPEEIRAVLDGIWITQNPEHACSAVLIADGSATTKVGPKKVLVVYVRDFTVDEGEITIVVPYRPREDPRGFFAYRPVIHHFKGPEPNEGKIDEALQAGIAKWVKLKKDCYEQEQRRKPANWMNEKIDTKDVWDDAWLTQGAE